MKLVTRWLALLVIVALAAWIKQSGFFEFALSVIHKMGVWAVPTFLSVYILSCLFYIIFGMENYLSILQPHLNIRFIIKNFDFTTIRPTIPLNKLFSSFNTSQSF